MTDTTDKSIPQYSKNPCIDLGIVENVSRIEVKWYLEGADSDQELEVWWKALVTEVSQETVSLLYDADPGLGFSSAERAQARFLNRHLLEHIDEEGKEVMQWRFEGESRDLDGDHLDDASCTALQIIQHELAQEIKSKPGDIQRVLAERVNMAIETFRDEIQREVSLHEDQGTGQAMITERDAQSILLRVHNRLQER